MGSRNKLQKQRKGPWSLGKKEGGGEEGVGKREERESMPKNESVCAHPLGKEGSEDMQAPERALLDPPS